MIERWVATGSMIGDSGLKIGPWSGDSSKRTAYTREWVRYRHHCNEVALLRREIKRLKALLERNEE